MGWMHDNNSFIVVLWNDFSIRFLLLFLSVAYINLNSKIKGLKIRESSITSKTIINKNHQNLDQNTFYKTSHTNTMAMRLITNKYTFSQTSKMVVIRHGESLWNKHRRWTGWNDVRLSSGGIKQAKECGKLLKDNGFVFDEAYSSILTRSIQTLNYVLD